MFDHLRIAQSDIDLLLEIADTDRNGSVDYSEFVHAVLALAATDERTLLLFIKQDCSRIKTELRSFHGASRQDRHTIKRLESHVRGRTMTLGPIESFHPAPDASKPETSKADSFLNDYSRAGSFDEDNIMVSAVAISETEDAPGLEIQRDIHAVNELQPKLHPTDILCDLGEQGDMPSDFSDLHISVSSKEVSHINVSSNEASSRCTSRRLIAEVDTQTAQSLVLQDLCCGASKRSRPAAVDRHMPKLSV